jgi:Tol biopolymer transport system component
MHAAVWSSNGRRVALATGSFPRVALHVVDADGSNRRALTRRFVATSITPVWSPNSRRIAFELYDDGCHSLYVVNAVGGGLKRLSKGRGCTGGDEDMAWSPDSKRIVFTNVQRLVVMDADGGNRRLLTRDPQVIPHENFDDKVWLPGVILFINTTFRSGTRDRDREWHLFSIKPDGSGLKDLTPDVRQVQAFAVAPDRRTIAYETTGERIFLVDLEGSNSREWAADAWHATWAPNSRRIAFTRSRGAFSTDIYAMNVDGSAIRNLTRTPAMECCATWRPAGR